MRSYYRSVRRQSAVLPARGGGAEGYGAVDEDYAPVFTVVWSETDLTRRGERGYVHGVDAALPLYVVGQDAAVGVKCVPGAVGHISADGNAARAAA